MCVVKKLKFEYVTYIIMIIIIIIMNLKILLPDRRVIMWETDMKFVSYYQYSGPHYKNGKFRSLELCDVEKIKELCGITDDLIKISPTIIKMVSLDHLNYVMLKKLRNCVA